MNLKFRPFSETDIDLLMSWVGSKKNKDLWVGAYFNYPLEREQFEWHLDYIDNEDVIEAFIVINEDTGQPLGYFEFEKTNKNINHSYISKLIVRPDQRQRGIGTAILKRAISHGFIINKRYRLEILVRHDHEAFIQLVKKASFVCEGTFRDFVKIDEVFFDCNQYSLLQPEWIP